MARGGGDDDARGRGGGSPPPSLPDLVRGGRREGPNQIPFKEVIARDQGLQRERTAGWKRSRDGA
uniref:Uncharacterized protein n=1 Tax=Oryza sativa subsp. japonica TaxID=39947 RepID=Q2QUD6_ORYSJ|nr:hypothetical protein LOC_Os12g16610 [Oryza sativa Japonica Group]